MSEENTGGEQLEQQAAAHLTPVENALIAELVAAGYEASALDITAAVQLAGKLINEAADGETVKAQVEELQAKVAKLEGELVAAKSAKPAPAATVKAASSKVRKLGIAGKAKAPEGGHKGAGVAQLQEGGTFELVASDGKHEVIAFHPIEAEGRAFVPFGHQMMLNVPIDLKGAAGDETVDGFALLHDGKQIDYAKLLEPLKIHAGEHHRVANAIFFG